LADVRSEVASGASTSTSTSTFTSTSTSTFDDDGDDDDVAVGGYDDGNGELHAPQDEPGYPRHPYAEGHDGYVRWAAGRARARNLAGTVAVDGGLLADDVWRAGLGVGLWIARFGIDNQLSFFVERPRRDALYLGSTVLWLAPVLRPHAIWRIGSGINYMIDGRAPGQGPRQHALGADLATQLDVFPVRPLVLSGRLDVGSLYKTFVVGARATAGVTFVGIELYGGYTLHRVGSVNLHGPTAGLRVWF
jgi:hypothetical protein